MGKVGCDIWEKWVRWAKTQIPREVGNVGEAREGVPQREAAAVAVDTEAAVLSGEGGGSAGERAEIERRQRHVVQLQRRGAHLRSSQLEEEAEEHPMRVLRDRQLPGEGGRGLAGAGRADGGVAREHRRWQRAQPRHVHGHLHLRRSLERKAEGPGAQRVGTAVKDGSVGVEAVGLGTPRPRAVNIDRDHRQVEPSGGYKPTPTWTVN